jgi:hypothetical protein
MGRFVVGFLLALGACKGEDLGPVHDGISRLRVRAVGSNDGYYVRVSFTARVQTIASKWSNGVSILAACQVGVDRLSFAEPAYGALEVAVAKDLEENVAITNVMPARPSACDLEFHVGQLDDGPPIARVCWSDGAIKTGACPPNVISSAGVGPTGVTAVLTKVTPEDADDIGFPAHLRIAYRVTAHRDMAKGAYFVRQTSCKGTSRNDDTWHSELQHLRAGESFTAEQNTYRIGRPAAGTPCETVFGTSPEVDGEVTELATFCHRDSAITTGPCAR